MKRENVVKKCLMGTKAVSAEGQKKKQLYQKKKRQIIVKMGYEALKGRLEPKNEKTEWTLKNKK